MHLLATYIEHQSQHLYIQHDKLDEIEMCHPVTFNIWPCQSGDNAKKPNGKLVTHYADFKVILGTHVYTLQSMAIINNKPGTKWVIGLVNPADVLALVRRFGTPEKGVFSITRPI